MDITERNCEKEVKFKKVKNYPTLGKQRLKKNATYTNFNKGRYGMV